MSQTAPSGSAAAAAADTSYEAELIGVDPDFAAGGDGDNDSAVGDGESALDSTASISSSILEYRKMHGRTYQNFKDAEYWAPNDEAQNDGLDMHHHMMYLLHDNKLFLAPIENPQEVLDVGTGTGIWAIDFAGQFPSAQVIGTDLSPIQPSWTPPNCKFELDDATQEWTYTDNRFDFVHIRLMLGSVADYVKLYKEAYRCLKPGGWIEHTDFSIVIQSDDDSLPKDCVFHLWNEMYDKAGTMMGRTFLVTENDQIARNMAEAGFSPIHTRNFKLPMGSWPADSKWKEIGVINNISCEQGLEGYVLYLATKVLGWEYGEVQALLGRMRSAMRNRSYHAYYPCATVWAQKPLS